MSESRLQWGGSFVMRDGQIIVMGASHGIGAAIAADLAHHGFTIVALSRSAIYLDGGQGMQH